MTTAGRMSLQVMLGIGLAASVVLSSMAMAQERGRRGPPNSRSSSSPDAGGRSVDLSNAIRPGITGDDLQVIIKHVDMDDGQMLLVETLLEDHVSRFNEEAQALRVALQEARPGHVGGETLEGMRRSQEAMNRQVEAMRAELTRQIQNAGSSEERARIREEFTRKMTEVMEQQESVDDLTGDPDSWDNFMVEQSRLLKEWIIARRALDDEFVSAMEIVLEREQLAGWMDARQEIRRRNTLPVGRIDGEKFDMIEMLEAVGMEEQVLEAFQPLMAEYALSMDTVLQDRDAFFINAAPVISEVLRTNDWNRMQVIIREEAILRIRVRDINLSMLDMLGTMLPNPPRDSFIAEVRTDLYRDVWGPGRLDRAIDAALELDGLTDAERGSIEGIRNQCNSSLEAAKTRQDAAYRQLGGERWAQEQIRRSSSSFTGAKVPSPPDSSLITDTAKDRREVESECLKGLEEILGAERYAKIPGTRQQPRGREGDRDRGRAQDEARRRRDEFYKRYDLNGDGELDAEERDKMRKQMQEQRRRGEGGG